MPTPSLKRPTNLAKLIPSSKGKSAPHEGDTTQKEAAPLLKARAKAAKKQEEARAKAAKKREEADKIMLNIARRNLRREAKRAEAAVENTEDSEGAAALVYVMPTVVEDPSANNCNEHFFEQRNDVGDDYLQRKSWVCIREDDNSIVSSLGDEASSCMSSVTTPSCFNSNCKNNGPGITTMLYDDEEGSNPDKYGGILPSHSAITEMQSNLVLAPMAITTIDEYATLKDEDCYSYFSYHSMGSKSSQRSHSSNKSKQSSRSSKSQHSHSSTKSTKSAKSKKSLSSLSLSSRRPSSSSNTIAKRLENQIQDKYDMGEVEEDDEDNISPTTHPVTHYYEDKPILDEVSSPHFTYDYEGNPMQIKPLVSDDCRSNDGSKSSQSSGSSKNSISQMLKQKLIVRKKTDDESSTQSKSSGQPKQNVKNASEELIINSNSSQIKLQPGCEEADELSIHSKSSQHKKQAGKNSDESVHSTSSLHQKQMEKQEPNDSSSVHSNSSHVKRQLGKTAEESSINSKSTSQATIHSTSSRLRKLLGEKTADGTAVNLYSSQLKKHLENKSSDDLSTVSKAESIAGSVANSIAESVSTSLSQLSVSQIPGMRESQRLGGPKYYICTINRKGQTKIIHEADPVLLGANNPVSFKAVAEEQGYEVMEYHLVKNIEQQYEGQEEVGFMDRLSEILGLKDCCDVFAKDVNLASNKSLAAVGVCAVTIMVVLFV